MLCEQVSMFVWPCPALAKHGLASHKHPAGLAGEQDRRLGGHIYTYMYAYCTPWEYLLNLATSWSWGRGPVVASPLAGYKGQQLLADTISVRDLHK